MTCRDAVHILNVYFFFFQAEDGIRDLTVTGVQTCALPISRTSIRGTRRSRAPDRPCPRAGRRASAATGRAGCRSWQSLETDQVEHRVAEEPGAAGAHARRDLNGGQR